MSVVCLNREAVIDHMISNSEVRISEIDQVELRYSQFDGCVAIYMASIVNEQLNESMTEIMSIVDKMIETQCFDPVTRIMLRPLAFASQVVKRAYYICVVAEFDSVESAVEHHMRHGGKVTRSGDRYFWYQAS